MTGREPTQPLGATIIGEWRHELRTPVNQILGYAEMLLEDTEPGSAESTALEGIIAQARAALIRVNEGLPPSGEATEGALLGVLDALVVPRDAIVEATQRLLATPRDAQLTADLDRIASAARRLTARPSVRHTPAAAAPVAPSVPVVGIVGPPATILVVDDVEENRAVLARRIEKLGHNVETAASGFEALDLVQRGTFDLVLLDVLMPGMDGLEVLARLKGQPTSRGIPVIMISALDDLTAVVRCIEAGAEDYLTKPFDPVLLRARIGACLEKKRLHDREADYLRQVGRVIEVAGEVEQGRYQAGALDVLARRDDELGRLARVFDAMAAGVQAREARLLNQLHELRDEIVMATREHPALAVTDEQQADPFRAGDVLAGRYEITETIGHGGMGVVYRALDRELGEEIAIKMLLHAALGDDPDALERFKTEIRLARRISHRNVVRTHDFGEADGIHFVTMECVRGMTVRDLLTTRGRLGPASALALIRQLVDALDVAHGAGVIHRDVKPENALLDADGVLKVMDFGIARLAERTSTRTMTGMILGTPSYMSPEQLLGEEIDARAALYAVGVVLYEALTGALPFSAPSPVALIGKVLSTSAPPPQSLNPDIPPALASLVMRLLAKQPDERPASAHVLGGLLAELA